ncbi:MAG: sigma-70 family RNA polymerase sigma factor [Cytophagales bacterium]|nr:MAG: sigma-70 family RNA polymerase sigma factor [Cytophagales bacterium]
MFSSVSQPELLDAFWQQIRLGDRVAFGQFVENQYNRLYDYGHRFTRDSDLVRDCIQDLFLSLWEKRDRLPDVQSSQAYALTALRNGILKTVTRQPEQFALDGVSALLPSEPAPDEQWMEDETTQTNSTRLQRLLAQLTDRQREVLYLKFYQNLPHETIADLLSMERQSVANLLHRALKELKHHWWKGVGLLWLSQV